MSLTGTHIQVSDLPVFAFGGDFERATANFAIGHKALGGDARIDNQFELLPAERALDGN